MRFVVCNFFTTDNSIVENYFDQEIVKELAFNSKIKTKLPGGKVDLSYDYVLIPILNAPMILADRFILTQDILLPKIIATEQLRLEVIFSIIELFAKTDNRSLLERIPLEISVMGEIGYDDMDITYSDGSFKKATNEASYGVSKLLLESKTGLYDDFTGKTFNHDDFSGKIPNGTNNIGELTGLKIAVANFGSKDFQLIISDSEYSIKCFREWYYTWKNNNFKNYAKKEIANKELIKEIFEAIEKSKKTVMFKWVKGHNNSPFNELCDELAKNILEG
jgi:ribonuclease HI